MKIQIIAITACLVTGSLQAKKQTRKLNTLQQVILSPGQQRPTGINLLDARLREIISRNQLNFFQVRQQARITNAITFNQQASIAAQNQTNARQAQQVRFNNGDRTGINPNARVNLFGV